MNEMLSAFKVYQAQHFPNLEEHTTLLAVSGGRDSVLMCELFHRASYPFAIAHVNFELRGDASERDAHFVAQLAQRYGVQLHSISHNTQAYARTHKLSIQMAARELRFAFFKALCHTHGYAYYATAHHQDDAVETYLINQIRGCGLSGLHGILPQQGQLIHPLLFATRQQIDSYIKAQQIDYVEDASNAQQKYMRNKIRHSLIPLLQEINPQASQLLWENTLRLQATEAVYKQGLAALQHQYSTADGQIDIHKLHDNAQATTLLYEWLSPLGFNHSQCTQMLQGTSSHRNAQTFVGTQQQATLNRGLLRLSPLLSTATPPTATIRQHTTVINKPIHLQMQLIDSPITMETDSQVALLDYDSLQFPLQLRRWRTGDRFAPLGMQGKSKLLSDFFTDLKLSPQEKEEVWLLCSQHTIVWVLGHRISHKAKIGNHTKRALRISWHT